MVLAELAQFVSTLISGVNTLLGRKERQLIDKRMEEASRTIQNASKEEIEKYDSNFRELLQRIEDEKKQTGIRRRRNGNEAIAICRMIDEVFDRRSGVKSKRRTAAS
jgi:hypothetical protein